MSINTSKRSLKRQRKRVSAQLKEDNKRRKTEFNHDAHLNLNMHVNYTSFAHDDALVEKLNDDIITLYNASKPTPKTFELKINIIKELREILSNFIITGSDVVPFGSSQANTDTNDSDLDLCFVLNGDSKFGFQKDKKQALQILRKIRKRLYMPMISELTLIPARAPILKFKAMDSIEVDLNVHNLVGIRNTHFIRVCNRLEKRFRPLIFIVKKWAKSQNIKEASFGTISSYSWTLMVIHFLQAAVNPPVLPIVMKLPIGNEIKNSNIFKLQSDLPLPQWQSSNTSSVAQLFLGFLEYYAHFNYQNGISIADGCVKIKSRLIEESENLDSYHWQFLCIQEPFSLQNSASSLYNFDKWESVLRIITAAYNLLSKSKNMQKLLSSPVCGHYVYNQLAN